MYTVYEASQTKDNKSNHPPDVKKQLPRMINQRISNLSWLETVFNSNKNKYQEALKNTGYNEEMKYEKKNNDKKKKKKRNRNIIWFNPPYSQSVKTNIGAKFLNLIDKHFKKTELHKFFNRKNVKISYSCMPNIESIISGHNRKLLQSTSAEENQNQMKTCSCRGGTRTVHSPVIVSLSLLYIKRKSQTKNNKHPRTQGFYSSLSSHLESKRTNQDVFYKI